MPFEFKRIQFPIWVTLAMMINKSQGQSLSVCGLIIENPCISHGQYVVWSRVGKPFVLFVLAPNNKTKFCISKVLDSRINTNVYIN